MTICKVIEETGAVPVKIWTDDVDIGSIEQLKNVARLPFVFHHVAAMPDVHVGMGATIGSVIATRGAVMPAAVGVDIGCGMLAAKTNLKRADMDTTRLSEALKAILRRTPVGFQQHKDKNIHWDACRLFEDELIELLRREPKVLDEMKSRHWTNEMGTLGGGNHFIELSADENEDMWIVLHTGSRGPGNVMASFFIRKAKALAQANQEALTDWNLAAFREGTIEFENYMLATSWAQRYAYVNRQEILSDVMKSLADVWPEIALDGEVINCHHNYVAKEEHFGEAVWVTRKGAIRAQAGEMGIIPGSMGTLSYLVRGLGHAESFNSSSHGAGRKMSRTQAQKAFTLEDLRVQTEGVVCRQDKGVIDEIPGAYKRIEDVMANQTDLTEIVHTLKQVLCVKG